MDEQDEPNLPPVGERLRAAREEKGMALEDVAAQTRIPRRHLASLEEGDWERLPAPTYTMGFAKSYATTVGLDRTEIADQLRAELGGGRTQATTAEVFEPADSARTMPKWLVLGAIAAVLLVVLGFGWLNNRSLQGGEESAAAPDAEVATNAPAPAAPPPIAQGPVVITANAPAWIQVYERGGRTLFQGELAAGQSYEVPADAAAPLLRAGKPEAIRVSVGTADAPPVGPAGVVAADVSLLGPDLLRGGNTPLSPAGGGSSPPNPGSNVTG